ncbi:MAG: hypothetical protein M0003_06950, partial [Acidithiobacillus sp.]|nr:hypothetical protein [Acidithiobacillus sp.]
MAKIAINRLLISRSSSDYWSQGISYGAKNNYYSKSHPTKMFVCSPSPGVTGILFGATSYFYGGRLLDIHEVALAAPSLKTACAVIKGIILGVIYLHFERVWPRTTLRRIPAPTSARVSPPSL